MSNSLHSVCVRSMLLAGALSKTRRAEELSHHQGCKHCCTIASMLSVHCQLCSSWTDLV